MKEKKSFKKIFKLASTIFLAALFRAVGIQLFLLPNAITLGGAVGVASTLSWLFKDTLPDLMGAFLVVINIPLVIISYFKTGKKFALKTGICLLLMGGMMELLGLFDVASLVGTVGAGEDKVLFALIGGVLCGLSLPMMLSIQASTGGSDIVALLLQRHKRGTNSMRVILYIDLATILVAALVSQFFIKCEGFDGFSVFVYSIATQIASEIVQEMIYKGYSSAMGLNIVTSKPVEVSEALKTKLGRGVTNIRVEGAYSHEEKTMVMCVVYKRQLNRAKHIIKETDENSFATVFTVREVVGKGFKNTETELEEDIQIDIDDKMSKNS